MKLSNKYRWYADMLDEYGDKLDLIIIGYEGELEFILAGEIEFATHYDVDGLDHVTAKTSEFKKIPDKVECKCCEGRGYNTRYYNIYVDCCACNKTGYKYE